MTPKKYIWADLAAGNRRIVRPFPAELELWKKILTNRDPAPPRPDPHVTYYSRHQSLEKNLRAHAYLT